MAGDGVPGDGTVDTAGSAAEILTGLSGDAPSDDEPTAGVGASVGVVAGTGAEPEISEAGDPAIG